MTLSVYVASRASIPERGDMWRKMRQDLKPHGVRITSTWIDEDGPGETADFPNLWERIRTEVMMSDRLIVYLEPDDFPVRGVLIEVGIALAFRVPVVIVAPNVQMEGRSMRPLGSWVMHPLVSFQPNMTEAFRR